MRKLSFLSGLVIAIILATGSISSAGPKSANSDQLEQNAGFGRPEAITGRIVMVVPEQSLLVLAVQTSPDEKTTIAEPNPNAENEDRPVQQVKIVRQGLTDFAFRLTASSLIRSNGERLSPADLATLTNQQATVRFIPHRVGNFVESVEVGG